LKLLGALLLLCAFAVPLGCESGTNDPLPGSDKATGDSGPTAAELARAFPDLPTLHDQAISRTCALNNGVCHNSKQYPDLRTPSSFLASTLMTPCNVEVDVRSKFKDACETPGDHLVIGTADEEILTADVLPEGAEGDAIRDLKLVLKNAPALKVGDGNIQIRRDAQVFNLPGATVSVIAGSTVTLRLGSDRDAKRFVDDRVYPWHDGMIRVADVNRNGVLGAPLNVHTIVPGDPMKSFLMLRIIDDAQGELMPLACRQWSATATRALGCWIEGLKTDDKGVVTNALDPIDYQGCAFQVDGRGRCADAAGNGFEGVEAFFGRTCGGAGCHVGEVRPAAGLDLTKGKAYGSLVDKPSSQVPSKKLVAPGAPAQSYLLCKLEGTCPDRVGVRMPKGANGVSETDLAAVREWIEAGAKPM
jgi:hypothetical protein